MNRKTLAAAFKVTLPVLAGYLAIGVAFGLMLEAIGYGAGWACLMSVVIYAGSAQYLGVGLLQSGAALTRVALLTFIVNFRHVVYGLSMLEKFRGMGLGKAYMIFSLTDETYALLSSAEPPEGVPEKWYYLSIAVLDHLYWIIGSVIGSIAGEFLNFNTKGVEFAMTALFVVIATEQWKSGRTRLPAVIGIVATLLSLLLVGREHMLLPALFIIVASLLILRGRLEGGAESSEEER